ncbi:MAG TPA: TetR/AcrR family transcriptional regulator [Streptosporangiaceae bacterium]|nr:TetR/AcrR family transcriptional regulator [Streptosporangiaceae bacterium]
MGRSPAGPTAGEVAGVTISPPQAGRPRDPDVDRRVADAAITLFGEAGWAGFSVEAVAKRACVGKASIYLRWPTKEALLVEALRLRVKVIDEVDTGSLREDLVRLARQILDLYLGDAGRAAMRLGLDGDLIPGLAEQLSALRTSQVLAARAIVRRGIGRGEIPEGTSITLLLDTLVGGATTHVQSTPEDRRDALRADADRYAEQLVDFLLCAVHSPAVKRS